MNPIYLDIHIHTSDNPEQLNQNYSLDVLIQKIGELSNDSEYLISITDHNTINKKTYLEAKALGLNIILGVELHIRNYDDCPSYHCHIYFDLPDLDEEVIDNLNKRLDELYPKKVVEKLDPNIPTLQDVINKFDLYEFILLPHGGQSHATFDTSIPESVKFDTTLEKRIYYNQFDGFTARGNTGLERTQNYFKKLGINEFVNLVTCSDNYNPRIYPNGKDQNPFIPTWMLANPTFNGLRLSLSESSRLIYSHDKPTSYSEFIRYVSLNKSNIEIDAELTPGLNVVIGGSSSGKTLFVDSIIRAISTDFSASIYSKYEVEKINVDNPSGMTPHFLSQNYIMSVVNNVSDNKIEDIEIIKKVFPGDDEIKESINNGLRDFKKSVQDLIKYVRIIETETENIKTIPILSRLLVNGTLQSNMFYALVPTNSEIEQLKFTKASYDQFNDELEQLDLFLSRFPFVRHDQTLAVALKEELNIAWLTSQTERKIRNIITSEKEEYDELLKENDSEDQTKKQDFDRLTAALKKYIRAYKNFHRTLQIISTYHLTFGSEEIESMGHKLQIENDFELNPTRFVDIVNHYLKIKIIDFKGIKPELLFEQNHKKQNPKVHNYDDFELKIYNDFETLNKKRYKIICSDGREFENLSPGWKTSIILDIILGYDKDRSPIIIDQPEDNLATNYINTGLVSAIKKIKSKKQVILVSHNATIPMLADAQNVVLCKNVGNKLIIKSAPLEGKINDKYIVDYIAEITDGGKSSIKKRVKKYNLKKFND